MDFGDWQIESLVQYSSNSIANALELLQPCTKPSILFAILPQEQLQIHTLSLTNKIPVYQA